MSLGNLWHLFNLRESPYFQQDLQASGKARYPIELFVGREAEAERIPSSTRRGGWCWTRAFAT
jgi:hypothetical protein